MIINRNTRRRPQPLLFPEWELSQTVYSWRQTTNLTGELFEALTGHVFRGTRRGTTNGAADHCPDLMDDQQRLVIESKGSNTRSQHKICPFQVERYDEMRRSGWQAVYCLWSYTATGLRKNFETVGRITEAVVGSVVYCDILDVRIIAAIVAKAKAGALPGVRWMPSWKKSEVGTRDECPIVCILQAFLKRLRAEPDRVLFDELGLSDTEFTYSAKGNLSAKVQYAGTNFKTSNFIQWAITEREGWVPF